MRKEEFHLLNNLYNGSQGNAACRKDIESTAAVKVPGIIKSLVSKGWVSKETGGVTEAGLKELDPYKVDNAVILAAGASTRCIPLSLELPKGLFEVKGERLIERQIKQLKSAGINDITIVLGYKKEMFFYLKDKYDVKFIINESFNIKNNIESLYLARKELKNTYICVSDSYFVENPFSSYEYCTYCAGMKVNKATGEMYADIDADKRITGMEKERQGGLILLGQSFWRQDFSDAFKDLMEADREEGRYDSHFWEWMVKDNLDKLPPCYFREYEDGNIFEFDYFEDLRNFDETYLGNVHSEILRNIKLIFRCDQEDIVDFRNVSEGLTNTSFIFKIDGVDYIYRHPGDGTESIVNRKNEKTSLIKAKEIGVDPTYIYADPSEGWKVSLFIPEFREPDYSSFEDSRKVISLMKKLHASDVMVDYGMKPWEDALQTEELLKSKDPDCFREYEVLKSKIEKIYRKTIGDGVRKCFCHGDTYKPNWMIRPDDSVILIDWEYSGYSDPGIDVGYYIVDAMYDFDEADRFIREYLGNEYTEAEYYHFMAYVPIIAYYWFVWALYRKSCGADVEDAIVSWRAMALKYADMEYLNK